MLTKYTMKLPPQQITLDTSNNTEKDKQLSLQNYIDNHYKCDVFESGMNEDFVIVESKINEL